MNLDPNAKMLLGAGLVALVVFGKPILSAINVEGIKNGLGKINPLNLLGGTTNLSAADVHSLVAKLMDYFTKEKDSQGLMLTAGVGQHIYEKQVKALEAEIKDNQPVSGP